VLMKAKVATRPDGRFQIRPSVLIRQQHESAKKREPQEPPNITWAGEPGKNLCSFQSPGKFCS
jgi:hypothetical protein